MQAESILQQHSSVYSIVTAKIIEQLENGVAPWRKPWRAEAPCNLVTGKLYRGINPFLLAPQGYGSRYWLTFNQTNKLGVQRKSKPILLRYYNVFNVEQTEGIAEKLGLGKSGPRVASIEACEAIVKQMPNAPNIEQSNLAWYRPSSDSVGMPSKNLFATSEEYYSTLFHELTHSTGHSSRVGREGIEQLNTFGSESYSKEELIAEMGAAMLCGVTGIIPTTIQNSASYLQHWIHALRGDSKLLVSAASQAQKAADYIQGGAL
jgi:antirestriction protein ArdC